MVVRINVVFCLAMLLSCSAPFPVWSASDPPAAVTSYTFLGRVMDAAHKAFDGNRTAKIAVYNEDASLLNDTQTFFREDSCRNYSLHVPMASAPADGYAVQNAPLTLVVTDDLGKTWRGVVVGATAGAPGAVREVDIVLGEDADGDGIDDALYARLDAEWRDSEWWSPDETFDPAKDYDGDGVSTLSEALAGTDPFDPDVVLKITSFSRSTADGTRLSASATGGTETGATPVALSFDAVEGHAYTVEEATDLHAKDWKQKSFSLAPGETPVNYLARPSDNKPPVSRTVYLLPDNPTNSFYRVRCE